MTPLDLNGVAVMGRYSAVDRSRALPEALDVPCDGCSALVLVMPEAIDLGRRKSIHDGVPFYVLCEACAQPWITACAFKGNSFMATPASIPLAAEMIDRARKRVADSN